MSKNPIRREGFAGQHQVVIPAPVRKAAASHPLLGALLVTDAGYYPAARGHRVERPQGASTHLVILCLEGRGWVHCRGRTESLGPGDILWLPAEQAHAYGADDAEPWTIVWAHFQGDEARAWQRELGWPSRPAPGVFHSGPRRQGTLGLDRVYAALEEGYAAPQLLKAGAALRTFFCSVLELAAGASIEKSAFERTASVRDELSANPDRAYRLKELATAAGLSIPHFCTLFRRLTGYAPIDFLLRQRIRRACRLLDTTQLSVAAIGSEVGFEDPYYFSRCFHRVMGSSPRAYRATVKG